MDGWFFASGNLERHELRRFPICDEALEPRLEPRPSEDVREARFSNVGKA